MHFFGLVFGEDFAEQLGPFHQYECTGHYDRYVVDVDITDEAMKEFEARRVKTKIRLADGEECHPHDIRFYSFDPKRKGMRAYARKPVYPKDSVEITRTLTLHEWLEDDRRPIFKIVDGQVEIPSKIKAEPGTPYYSGVGAMKPFFGYGVENENGEIVKIFERTNPNARWDWWVPGGRWSDWLRLKPDTSLANQIAGIFRPQIRAPRYTSQARICDVDWQAMEQEAAAKADSDWALVNRIFINKPWSPRSMFAHIPDRAKAESAYFKQRGVRAAARMVGWWLDIDEFLLPDDEYRQCRIDATTLPYFTIRDGTWLCGDDHRSPPSWGDVFRAYRDSLDPQTLVTVIDCHM